MQTIHQQIMYEIQQIPEAKLVSLYDAIRHFRRRVDNNASVRDISIQRLEKLRAYGYGRVMQALYNRDSLGLL